MKKAGGVNVTVLLLTAIQWEQSAIQAATELSERWKKKRVGQPRLRYRLVDGRLERVMAMRFSLTADDPEDLLRSLAEEVEEIYGEYHSDSPNPWLITTSSKYDEPTFVVAAYS